MDNGLNGSLNKYFGFDKFKKGQKEVIESVLNNGSSAAIFPTGAGKSLCYQLPALILPGLTIVVSPLLSLMKNQLDFLSDHNIPAARLDSSLNRDEYAKTLEDAISGKLKILMVSVERFKNERFRYHLNKMNISLMVIDEAHCISEWGHNFRPEYLKLPEYRDEFGIERILLLTATATPEVIEDMKQKFRIDDKDVIITGFYRDNLYLKVSEVSDKEKRDYLLHSIKGLNGPTIVYVTLQKTAEDVAEFLSSNGYPAKPYHAGLKNDNREEIQNRFMDGEVNYIVATIAFGMGIDKKDIRQIIHYDLPKTIENYSQEIGRAGRDGEKAFCEVFAGMDNINILKNFVYGDTPEREGIFKFLSMVKESGSDTIEVKDYSLTKELDIRYLPFKTLLVYLDMHAILKPMYSYFGEYSFKFIENEGSIIDRFKGERREFVEAIFRNCEKKKVWTYPDIDQIIKNCDSDRKRVITALEYFDEKGLIELEARQSVDAYRILDKDFNTDELADKMYNLFTKKEKNEIKRIEKMIGFFESASCISGNLAEYFGEHLENSMCGHCSFCSTGTKISCAMTKKDPLQNYNPKEIKESIEKELKTALDNRKMAKLLCGIHTPSFIELKARKSKDYGIFESYPLKDVESWINMNS